jgi:toxin-antitoxin system PIN domain toxin
MILFDVNILVNAHRGENTGHAFYLRWLTGCLEARETFLYCELILSAFVRIVTHPRVYRTPTPLSRALAFADEVRRRPNGMSIMPGAQHWGLFTGLCRRTSVTGNGVPDAYLAALAIEAKATWVTADDGFARFTPDLKWELLRPSSS